MTRLNDLTAQYFSLSADAEPLSEKRANVLIRLQHDELARLRAVIEKLALTADGVRVPPGTPVYKCWWNDRTNVLKYFVICTPYKYDTRNRVKLYHMATRPIGNSAADEDVSECYTTKKAARAGYTPPDDD